MCFGKNKSVKSLKSIKNTMNNVELGYNIMDTCEYIDYECIGELETSQNDLHVVQINTRGMKSK